MESKKQKTENIAGKLKTKKQKIKIKFAEGKYITRQLKVESKRTADGARQYKIFTTRKMTNNTGNR